MRGCRLLAAALLSAACTLAGCAPERRAAELPSASEVLAMLKQGGRGNVAVTTPDADDPVLRPRSYAGKGSEVARLIEEAVTPLPHWEVIAGRSGVIWVTRRTRMGFVHDVYLLLVPSADSTVVFARSASRVGKYDFGQNRRNLAELWAALDQRARTGENGRERASTVKKRRAQAGASDAAFAHSRLLSHLLAFFRPLSPFSPIPMPAYYCITCGTQHADTEDPPAECLICLDERQFIGWEGQAWTTLDALRRTHHNRVDPEPPGLLGIGTEPKFAIGQRALLVRPATLPVLWDCVSLVDDATVAAVGAAGGVRAIAISHPHYYSGMIEWSRALGGIPIYLHEADRRWVMRPDPAIRFWSGDTHPLADGLTLIRTGGHFDGATVLHVAAHPPGGALLTGDVIQVCEAVAG